jgi:hypothetical protein
MTSKLPSNIGSEDVVDVLDAVEADRLDRHRPLAILRHQASFPFCSWLILRRSASAMTLALDARSSSAAQPGPRPARSTSTPSLSAVGPG